MDWDTLAPALIVGLTAGVMAGSVLFVTGMTIPPGKPFVDRYGERRVFKVTASIGLAVAVLLGVGLYRDLSRPCVSWTTKVVTVCHRLVEGAEEATVCRHETVVDRCLSRSKTND